MRPHTRPRHHPRPPLRSSDLGAAAPTAHPGRVVSTRGFGKRAVGALVTLALALLALGACDEGIDAGQETPGEPVEYDLSQILEGDTLTALVTYNSTGYFIYRGEPMGFEYRLLKEFAEEHDVVLDARVVHDRDQLFSMLNAGEGDVVAARVVPAESDTGHVAYTSALYTTRPATVQRAAPAGSVDAPAPVDTIVEADDSVVAAQRPIRIQARLIEQPAGLAGREVHLPSGTFYDDRLIELSDSLGEDITVVAVDSVSYETLMRRLAQGEIRLMVAPENIAQLRESYYTNLEVTPVIGSKEPVVWAVRENSTELQAALNQWIEQEQELINTAYQRYFVDRQGYNERVRSEYLTSETGRLSEYDALFKEEAQEIGWDWRLLASQAFQESKFQPSARSWAGAMGLLQLMPATAREVDVADPMDPEENVAGAVRYLRWLTDQWQDSIPDPDQRLRFILASYNAGAGHVEDARRLTEKHGGDPNSWDDVAYWLLQKSKKAVYNDPVVRYGFARGLEPVTYVSRILDRYSHYLEFVTDDGPATATPAGGNT